MSPQRPAGLFGWPHWLVSQHGSIEALESQVATVARASELLAILGDAARFMTSSPLGWDPQRGIKAAPHTILQSARFVITPSPFA